MLIKLEWLPYPTVRKRGGGQNSTSKHLWNHHHLKNLEDFFPHENNRKQTCPLNRGPFFWQKRLGWFLLTSFCNYSPRLPPFYPWNAKSSHHMKHNSTAQWMATSKGSLKWKDEKHWKNIKEIDGKWYEMVVSGCVWTKHMARCILTFSRRSNIRQPGTL